jgi:hypothetical protein
VLLHADPGAAEGLACDVGHLTEQEMAASKLERGTLRVTGCARFRVRESQTPGPNGPVRPWVIGDEDPSLALRRLETEPPCSIGPTEAFGTNSRARTPENELAAHHGVAPRPGDDTVLANVGRTLDCVRLERTGRWRRLDLRAAGRDDCHGDRPVEELGHRCRL